jgi:hypothetical protein
MAKSTNFINDLTTAITNGPQGTTLANAIAAAGPIMDYKGNCQLALLKMKGASNLLGGDTFIKGSLKQVTDAGDTTNLGLINGLIAVLNGTSSPSTQAITDSTTLFNNARTGTGVGAATTANCNAAAGPIMDYVGNSGAARKMLEEIQVLLAKVASVTDQSGDATNYALINNIVLALV